MTPKELNIEALWKQNRIAGNLPSGLNPEKITQWFKKKPGGIYSAFTAGIYINFFQKCIFIFAQLGLLSLMINQKDATLIVGFFLLVSVILSILDFQVLKKIRILRYSDTKLSENLEDLQYFIKTDYSVYRLYSAFTNPILIFTGAMYYDFFKYGHLNIFSSGESILVFFIFVFIGYILAYFAGGFSIKQIENDIETYIDQLESDQISVSKIEKLRKRKRRNILIMVSVLLMGLVLFVFFWKINQN